MTPDRAKQYGIMFIAALILTFPPLRAAAGGKGCLSCHEGIAVINIAMQPWLIKQAEKTYGKGEGYECAICHEGNPASASEDAAHKGMIPNPSYLWALNLGKGCAKCHDEKNSLATMQANPLPSPAGGAIQSYISRLSDPTGAEGFNLTYRVVRSLMALETGKANKILSANGIIEKGLFPFADFDMDDPDGPTPLAGSFLYKRWIKKAAEEKLITILSSVRQLPDFNTTAKHFSEEQAGFADLYRKECGRCHLWGEGRDKRGDRRAAGCAACHVLYNNAGSYQGNDKAMQHVKRAMPMKHRITVAIPSAQCTHCHTRGKRIGTTFSGMMEYDYQKDGKAPPFDSNGNPQAPLFTKEYMHIRSDVHQERGMECIDCHTSIDLHGDGNIYPVTWQQVETGCQDCHGTTKKFPWELPVGYGTPVTLEGARGTYPVDKKEYLITSRGNVRRNWIRRGDEVFVRSAVSGKEHKVPLLKDIAENNAFKTGQGKTAMVSTDHIERLECYACHATWAPQCYGCHIKYDRRRSGTDWLETAHILDPVTGRGTPVKTMGALAMENRSFLRWEDPVLGMNSRGRVTPVIPGCQVFYTYIDKDGNILETNRLHTTSSGDSAATMAPVQPHSITAVARTCENCHTDPKAIGYGAGNSRSTGKTGDGSPLFTDMSKGVNGDIPGSGAPWQVPPVTGFPWSLDQLVDRNSGKQIQNMPLPGDRPLDRDIRMKTEREGLCIACHQYSGSAKWEKIIKKYGRANTPEAHDRMLRQAVELMIGKAEQEARKQP